MTGPPRWHRAATLGVVAWWGVVADRFSGTAQWTRDPRRETGGVAVRGQALGLLVPVSCTHCWASTSGLSTPWSGGGPYQVDPVGDLILKRASRLDAFSGYPCRT